MPKKSLEVGFRSGRLVAVEPQKNDGLPHFMRKL